jgi:hypothetical protein
MTIKRSVFAIAGLVLIMLPTRGVAQTASEIVAAHYPDERLSVDDEDQKENCFVVLSSDVVGAPTKIAAVYTNGIEGVLRVLIGSGSSFAVDAESGATTFMIGHKCAITAIDLTGDGAPELYINFGRAQAWVYALSGSTLTNLTPVETYSGRDMTRLYGPALCDVRHDGTVQVCTAADDDVPAMVYRSTGTTLVPERFALTVLRFQADWVVDAKTASFSLLQDSVGPFTVRIVNGDRNGQHRVTSGSVRVNNVERITSSQLTDSVEFIEAEISGSLLASNEISVSLTGAAGSAIFVIVRDSTPR